MKRASGIGFLLTIFTMVNVSGQLITADPEFPVHSDSVMIVFDATQGNKGLMGYTGDVYAHTGLITDESISPGDWKYAPTWGDNSPKYKLERIDTDIYQLKIFPSIDEYYGVGQNEVAVELAFVFRSADNSKVGKTSTDGDIFYPVSPEGLHVTILSPTERPLIIMQNDPVIVEVQSHYSDSLFLFYNDSVIRRTDEHSIFDTLLDAEEGKNWIKAVATNDTSMAVDSLYFVLRGEVEVEQMPVGLEDGINYLNDTTVSLVLYAPGKEYVFVIGDFNHWEVSENYYMKKTPDGNRFWLTMDDLEAGKEYIFQYFVDGSIRIGDPYAEKVSDPWNDKYISEDTYPGLLPYPFGKTSEVATYLQTAEEKYQWKNDDFTAPAKEDLVVYEMLLRDFTQRHDYRSLIDTIDYFVNLGINAIELMPVNEFEGNNSWGYNVSYYFAPDKYYGPKKDLQAFIDTCHSRGIAVILDVVYNHSFGQSPMARLYWDWQTNNVTAENPWFNTVPKHDFNVGYDFNHESPDTKYLVSRAVKFWLREYKVDGFRFDLSKGFTQKNTLGDAGAMAKYDASRIAILKQYADSVWSVKQDAYVILEHFAENDEEMELVDKGMMIWGNLVYNYARAGMGWHENGKSDFSWGSYQERDFSKPHLVSYMESHDEQRHLYDVKAWGNFINPLYNVRDNLELSLIRAELCAAFFFTVPGPKMIWQFGELGYDYSINYNGRLGPKPIRWDYYENPNRKRLYEAYSALARLKQDYPAFKTIDFSIDVADTMKTIHLRHTDMDVTIIGNFDTYPQTIDPSFTKTGKWYDYMSGDSILVSDVNMPVILDKSEYRIYTSKRLATPDIIAAPKALDVSISGNMAIGEPLTGNYTYFDQNADLEGQSKYKWWKGKNPDGSDKMQILGATGTTYTIKESDWNHNIFFEVTPVAQTGELLTGIMEYGLIDLATGIDKPYTTDLEKVLVYPNPSNDGFNIHIESPAGKKYLIELFNVNGSLVYRSDIYADRGISSEFYIDGSYIDRGLYILKISSKEGQTVRRISKF